MSQNKKSICGIFVGVAIGIALSNPLSIVKTKEAHADSNSLDKIHRLGDELKDGLTNKNQTKLRACLDSAYCQNFERLKMGASVTNIVYHRGTARRLDANTATFLIEMERNGVVTLSRATLKKKNGVWKVSSIK